MAPNQLQETGSPIVRYAIQHASTSTSEHSRPVPDSSTLEHEHRNAQILNETLQKLQPYQTLVIDQNYHLLGGIIAHNLTNVTIVLDGQLIFSRRTRHWPRSAEANTEDGRTVLECIHLVNPINVTLTSSHRSPRGGTLNGQGSAWWGLPFIGYVRYNENRPRLLRITRGINIVLENWLLLNSPYWSTLFEEMDGLTIRYIGVLARRTSSDGHSLLDLSAFNTDGLDITGRNVHVHDSNIWVQDDCIAVKDGPMVGKFDDGINNIKFDDADRGMRRSSDMVFERINASGLGLTIGSIGNYSIVRNITFQDCYLKNPVKGIYTKFRKSNLTRIEDVTFKNIIMDAPQQFAIWIGPAQQADSVNICHANPCSLCWPFVPGSQCSGEVNGTYRNLLLKNIQIIQPQNGGGVLMASGNNPMRDVVFDGVKVGCGPLHHEGNDAFTNAFPLLPNEYKFDVHVLIFQLMCFVFLGGLVWICWMISRIAWSETRKHYCFGIVGIPLSLCVGRIAYISLAMGSAEKYFVCEGVHGEAIGDTFPVPSCLDDHTNVDTGSRGESLCSTQQIWQEPLLGATLSAFFTAVGCTVPLLIRYTHYQQHQSHQRIAPTDEALHRLTSSSTSENYEYEEVWTENETASGVAMISLRGRREGESGTS